MSAYVDIELAQALALAGKALVDLEIALGQVKGYDMYGEREPVQEVMTSGLILTTSGGDPYAVLRMEDVWVECNVLTPEETEVVKKAQEMLTWPNRFIEKAPATEG